MSETWQELNFSNPPNKVAALTAALVLAISASDEQRTERASRLAHELAKGMTRDEIEQAKSAAAEHFD